MDTSLSAHTQPKKVYIETWGCQMNDYDSQRIVDLLKATHALERVDTPENADLLLMNTCAIREKAQEKVFSQLGRWRAFKEARPEIIIGVGGCVASSEGQTIRQRAPYVDLIFGPQTLHRLPYMLKTLMRDGQPLMDISFPSIEKFDHLPQPRAEGPTAYVSIQEGCNKYCKYCIVPFTRGEEVNRPFADVLAEIHALAQQGVREVTLLGQNVNAYRAPLDPTLPRGEEIDLGVLIAYVARIPGIIRIRFTTSHPGEFNDSLIHAYATVPALASHLHLPIQSGSDRILRLMGRQHTVKEYAQKIQKLRAVRPDVAITSDFIVGYPGETEEDFQDTLAVVDSIRFDHSYSFMYSPRPGTMAAQMPDDVPLEIKKDRLKRLQDRIEHYAQGYSQAMLGTHQSIILAKSAQRKPGFLCGRTENNRSVFVQADPSWIGALVLVRIDAVHPASLTGTCLSRLSSPAEAKDPSLCA